MGHEIPAGHNLAGYPLCRHWPCNKQPHAPPHPARGQCLCRSVGRRPRNRQIVMNQPLRTAQRHAAVVGWGWYRVRTGCPRFLLLPIVVSQPQACIAPPPDHMLP